MISSNVSGLIANFNNGAEHAASPSSIHTPNFGVSIQ